jgi:hypothetical protein
MSPIKNGEAIGCETSLIASTLQAAVWKSKPFYSAAVHRELQELSGLLHSEAIEYQHGDPYPKSTVLAGSSD